MARHWGQLLILLIQVGSHELLGGKVGVHSWLSRKHLSNWSLLLAQYQFWLFLPFILIIFKEIPFRILPPLLIVQVDDLNSTTTRFIVADWSPSFVFNLETLILLLCCLLLYLFKGVLCLVELLYLLKAILTTQGQLLVLPGIHFLNFNVGFFPRRCLDISDRISALLRNKIVLDVVDSFQLLFNCFSAC